MKKIHVFFILLAILPVIIGMSCTSLGETGTTQPEPEQRTVKPQTQLRPPPPYSTEVSFPEGAPRLHSEAVLTCAVNSRYDLTNLNIEIRLPESLELVAGELSWLGDINSRDEIVVIRANVRAIDIGNWSIQVRNSMEPETQGFSLNPDWMDAIYVSIYKESAVWGKYHLWYEGKSHVVSVARTDDPLSRMNTHLSISHPPKLNEPAEIICTIIPYIDCPDAKAEIVLPDGATLIDGTLEWQGDLKSNMPVNYLAKISFNETGDFHIDAGLWRWFDGNYSWQVTDSLYLQIGVNESQFGSPPAEDMSNRPPPPATST
jgi:hypothetical protein